LVGSGFADATITTRLMFKENIRQQVHIYLTSNVPDSEMNDFANRALLWTSVDVGGVESRVRLLTVAGKANYVFPDTVVEVLAQIQFSGDVAKQLKATYPQFREDLLRPTELTELSTDPNAVATDFIYWDDTLILAAVPVKVDTIYFLCYVEHPSLSSDTMAIRMRPAFTEAAVSWACYLILSSLEEFQDAAIYKGKYDYQKAVLRERYRPKFDILRTQ
jgi:hypothetical protein